MNREQLRSLLLSEADKLRNSMAWRFMSDQERNLSICGRQFWSLDNPVTNVALDNFATILSTMQSQPSPAMKGPNMKTLASPVKAAFANAGISLTAEQEHVAASITSIDWPALIAELGAAAVKILPIILAAFGVTVPPAANP